jgi:autotransporter-associated beta strand protein
MKLPFLPNHSQLARVKFSSRASALLAAIVALIFVASLNQAHAQRTWLNPANKVFDYQATGGAWSPNWWSPENSTTLIFDGGNNDYTGNITNNSTDWNNYGIRFQNDMLSVTITGNSFDLSISSGTAKIENATTNTQTIAVTNVSMDNGVRELNPIDGDLVFNVQNIFMGNNGTGGINVWGNNGKTLWLNGVVSESGTLGIQENSTVVFQKTNTYTGQTFIHGGQLIISNGARAGTGNINLGGNNAAGNALANAFYLGLASDTGGITNTNQININAGGGASTIGANNTSGVNTFSGPIVLGKNVNINNGGGTLSINGVISGSGFGITKQGAGVLILSNANTYTGTTTVDGGTLRLSAADRISDSSALTVNTGATFDLNNFNESVGALNGAGSITLGSGTLTTSVGSTATFSGGISGTGGLTKTGSAQLNLSGSNSYTGATAVNNGTLEMQNADALGATNGATTVASGATLKIWSASGFTTAAEALNISGNGVGSGGALLNEGGNNTYAGAITLQAASRINANTGTTLTLDVGSGSAITGTHNLTFGGSGNIVVNDNIAISSGSITKDGAGRLTISGTQTATGGITISSGSLFYNSSNSGSGAVTVNSGGTLAGTGSVGATTINSGGTMNPGNSPGSQTFATLSWGGGGHYNWQVYDAAGAAGTGYDTFVSTGLLNITATSTNRFNINLWSLSAINPDANGNAINFTNSNTTNWVLGTFGSISGFSSDAFSLNTFSTNGTGGFQNALNGTFSISTNSSQQLLLVYTATASSYTINVGTGVTANQDGAGIGGAALLTGPGASVTKIGAGTVVMTNSLNDYTGSTTIVEGGMSIIVNAPVNAAGALGSASSPVNLGASTNAVAANFNFGAAVDNGRTLNIVAGSGAGGTRSITTSIGSGTATQSGGVTVGTNTAITAASGSTLAISGALSGSGTLNINGSGVTVLSGNSSTFSGAITNQSGSTLRVGNNNGLGTGGLTLNGGTLAASSGDARTLGNNITLGANVTFGDGTGTGDLALNGTMALNGATRTLNVGNNTTVGGVISGGAGNGLTKSGSGTLTLSGVNTFSGPLSVNAGQVTLANSGGTAVADTVAVTVASGATLGLSSSFEEIGSLAGEGNVTLGSNLLIAGGAGTATTFSGIMSGTGGFVKKGAGVMTLEGANTYSGQTYIVGGTLLYNSAPGTGGTGIINIGEENSSGLASTFAIGGSGLTIGNNINVRAGDSDTATIDAQNTTGTTTLNGSLTLGKNADIRAASGGLLVNGNITGNFTLGKRGTGTATLAGTTAGGTKFDLWEGELQISSASNLGNKTDGFINNKIYFDGGTLGVTGNVSLGADNGMFIGAAGGTFRVASANTLTVAGAIGNGATNVITKTGDGTLTLTSTGNSGNNRFDLLAGELQVGAVGNLGDKTGAFLGNKLFFNGGTLGVTGNITLDGENGVTLGGNGTIRVDTGNTLTLQGYINDQENTGVVLSKTGAGTLFFDKADVNDLNGTTIKVAEGTFNVWNTGLLPAGLQLGDTTTSGSFRYNNGDNAGSYSGNIAVNAGGGSIEVAQLGFTSGGAISGSGNLSKTGSGSLTLTGNSGYSGDLTVSAGTLQLNRTGGASLGSVDSITVSSTATLLISQSNQVNNSAAEVTLSGGTITRATGVSEVFGNLNVSAASFLNFGSGTAGSIEFGTYTRDTGSALLTVQNFFQGNSLVFSQNLVDLGYISASSTGSFNNGYFAFADGFNTTWNGSDTFTITAIPEPSTYVAAAGLLALFLWPVRRRLIKDAKSILGLRPAGRDRIEAYRNA